MITRATIIALFLLICTVPAGANEVLTHGNGLSVDVARDASVVMDLSGALWKVPPGGGEAMKITEESDRVTRPRLSPDGAQVIYVADGRGKPGLRLLTLSSGETETVGANAWLNLQPSWHPGGERVVFASDRRGTGFDIWEVDLPTGLEWRLSSRSGDEMEPAWSADGRDLLYVHRDGERWSLVLRRHGQPEEILVTGSDRLSGPSWRPDGSLVTFWRHGDEELSLDMVILSEPRLVRRYMSGEAFTPSPVSWLDKHRLFYSAGGLIRQRRFNSWSSRTVPFRATIRPRPELVAERIRRTLPSIDEPDGMLVVRAARLFDGIGGGYQLDRDIVIEGGRIVAIEDRADRPGAIIVDMGDLAVMPGLLDVRARLPEDTDVETGPLLLAAGVTTVVADHGQAEHLSAVWSNKDLPGPRLLSASDWPESDAPSLADSRTPGLDELLLSRPARLMGYDEPVARRFSEAPVIDHGKTDVVLGSLDNGMPAGIATQAELRRVAPGAAADLLFIDGDPLGNVADTLQVLAVIRNGRFFSVAGLIDRARSVRNVE